MRCDRVGQRNFDYAIALCNSTAKGNGSGMTSKGKRNETLELHARPIQPPAEDAANHEPNHDEIRRRAYEIYLEGGSLPGRELDDWLRAERELRKVALFTQDGNRLEQHRRDSGDGN
jgi:hypothetical protein